MRSTKFDILWVVFFSALATGFLATIINVNSIFIGVGVGLVGVVVAFLLLKYYDSDR